MAEGSLIREGWRVVRNEEGRHSVWPQGRAMPEGWQATEVAGSRADCLAALETLWRDPRPAALRHVLDSHAPEALR